MNNENLLDAACAALVLLRKLNRQQVFANLTNEQQGELHLVGVDLHMAIRDAGLNPSKFDPREREEC